MQQQHPNDYVYLVYLAITQFLADHTTVTVELLTWLSLSVYRVVLWLNGAR